MARLNRAVLIIIGVAVLLFLPVLFTVSKIAGNFGDIYLHYYPLKYLVLEHLLRGKMALWNPYIFAGEPLMANPQSALFYPLSMVFYLFPLPAAFNYFFLFHFILAGIFFYLLLAFLRFGRSASLLGALAFAFSSFMVYKVPAGHPVALSGYVWLPLVMLACEALRTKQGEIASALLLGLVLTLQFLSGHTFPVYISFVFIVLHFSSARFSYAKGLLIAAGCCIALCALQLVPTLELAQVSERANWPALVASYSMPFKNLANLFMPNFYGNIVDRTFVYPENPSFFFERHALYIGVIPLLLAVSGLYVSLKQRRFFFPGLVITGLVLAFGFHTPVYRFFYRLLPGMDFLRVPARFYLLSVAGLCVLAAFAWEYFFDRKNELLKALLLLLVIADLLAWGKHFIYAESMETYRRKSEVTALVNPLYRVATEPSTIPPDKSMLYHHYNLNGYEAIFLQDFTRYIGLQEKQVLSTTGLARIDLESPLARGFAVGYRISLQEEEGKLLATFPNGLLVYALEAPLPRLFFPRTLKSFTGENVYEEINYLNSTVKTPDRELTIGPLPGGFPSVAGNARLISYTADTDKITAEIELSSPAAVVFSEIFYPGWRAYAQGKAVPVVRGNKVFRTLLLPGGEYTGKERICLLFDPVSWRFGLYFSLAALAILIVYLLKYSKVL